MAIEQIDKSKKEIESQVKDFSDEAKDILEVKNKDPNFSYRWINTHKQNLAMKQAKGWEIVNDPKIKTFSGSPDSTHHLGDMVLARMPKDKYERMMREKKDLGDRRRKAVKEEYREEAKRSGIPTFDENR